MKVALVGYGAVEGPSALQYWLGQGAEVTICDQNSELNISPGVEKQLGPGYLDDLDRFDVILRTPGMHPRIILEKNPNVTDKITTTLNEFLRVSPTQNIIGVTGTKGKGTTCMLITKMLEAAGKHAFLGGNFGISPFDFLTKLTSESWVVLEFSSYMLYDISKSPHIGVCLLVEPEHLDWHGDKDDYFRSKSNMFAHQTEEDIAIYYADNLTSHKIASSSPGTKIAYYAQPGAYIDGDKIMIDQTVLAKTGELKLLGKHNWQNICAAATAVWQVTQAPDAIREVLTTFTGLPHRIEFVREVNGVRYYNDSFASDPYASEAAIEAITGKKVCIFGGWDERKLPLKHFAKHVASHHKDIRTVLLIGASAGRLGTALRHAGFTNFHLSPGTTVEEFIAEAKAHAKKGDAVVFSPGFPSFDMFKNFEIRGLKFKEAVHDL